MKNTLCTISTKSHLYKVKALFDSVKEYSNCNLAVLIVDDNNDIKYDAHTYFLKNFGSDISKKIIAKYQNQKDKLRWALKSSFINLLLNNDVDKVIYIDNDIYFYNNFNFIWEELKDNNVLLTPHYYPFDPLENQNWFEANFRVGLYNAGFFAANKDSKKVLNWWSEACLYRMEKNYFRGLFDDQKYLDLIPNIFPKIKVLKHQGCNVAEWNNKTLERAKNKHNIIINNKFPLIFYHYNNYSVQKILEDETHILRECFHNYFENLKLYNANLKLGNLYEKKKITSSVKLKIWKFLNNLNK